MRKKIFSDRSGIFSSLSIDQGILELHFFSKLCPVDHFWKCAYMRLSLSNQEGILVRNAFEFLKNYKWLSWYFWLFLSIRMLSFTTEACSNRMNLCVALTNHKISTWIRRSRDKSRLFIFTIDHKFVNSKIPQNHLSWILTGNNFIILCLFEFLLNYICKRCKTMNSKISNWDGME